MTATHLLDAGRLTAPFDQLSQDVRTHPVDSRLRTFLFEVLCFAGDYSRAKRQLDVIAQQDQSTESGVSIYRDALTAERARLGASEDLLPTFLLQPPPF